MNILNRDINEVERILIIIPALNVCGGMESFIMNYFRSIDKSKYIFDFITHEIGESSYAEEIISYGGKIYKMPAFTIKNIPIIERKYKEILKINKYNVVHCNMANGAFLYLRIAKKMNVAVRIIHSHQNKASDKLAHSIRNVPLNYIGKKYSNVFIACSKEAGDYLFKNKPYSIINNAIDYEKFYFNKKNREIYRKKYNLQNSFVIGHTGRLCNQKNQMFLLNIFIKIQKIKKDCKLILIGEGESYIQLKKFASEKNIEENVVFLGAQENISELLCAMDVFVFPSLYEGLGISILEAQVSGLDCYASTEVPRASDISGNVCYLPLDEMNIWIDKILSNKTKEIRNNLIKLDYKYDIKKQVKVLENFYLKKIEEFSNEK